MKKMCLLLALLLTLTGFSALPEAHAEDNNDGKTYTQTLFDQSKPIEIDILMDDETWNNMIATASEEEYSSCNLMVNGVLYENVAIRPKGNSSKSSVSSRGSERFSWRIKFDKYEKKRTCDGLDILILNNGFKDPGELREAIAYDMYAYLNADASLYNYAIVSHNGEYFGCYLALEGVDKSFVKSRYGKDYGELYKPDATNNAARKKTADGTEENAAGGKADDMFSAFFGRRSSRQQDGDESAVPAAPEDGKTDGGGSFPAFPGQGDWMNGSFPQDSAEGIGDNADGQKPADDKRRGNMPTGFNFNMFGGGGSGTKSDSELAMALNYVGDDLETYQTIWDSSKFSSEDEDHARVVEALKHICQGDSIADYLNVDNVLKYFAIQTFIYNHDGLTGTVSHNYYLYEENGKLNLIPWDMNEAFTLSGDGSDFVNFPIDTPFTVTDLSERSFFMALLENEEYLEQYHEYLRILSEEYALGGGLEAAYERIRGQIDTLVETDPTAFSTYEEYDSAATSLKLAVELRAQSVLGQLSGEIPSTREGQTAEPEKLLDVSGEDLSGLTSGYGMGKNTFTMNFPGMK